MLLLLCAACTSEPLAGNRGKAGVTTTSSSSIPPPTYAWVPR